MGEFPLIALLAILESCHLPSSRDPSSIQGKNPQKLWGNQSAEPRHSGADPQKQHIDGKNGLRPSGRCMPLVLTLRSSHDPLIDSDDGDLQVERGLGDPLSACYAFLGSVSHP